MEPKHGGVWKTSFLSKLNAFLVPAVHFGCIDIPYIAIPDDHRLGVGRYRSCPLFQRCSPGFIQKLMTVGGKSAWNGMLGFRVFQNNRFFVVSERIWGDMTAIHERCGLIWGEDVDIQIAKIFTECFLF